MAVVVRAALLDGMMLTHPHLLFLRLLRRTTILTAANAPEDAPVPRHPALITTRETETETVIGTTASMLPTPSPRKATIMTTPATETVTVTGAVEDVEIEIATAEVILPRPFHQDRMLQEEVEVAAA
jgi:hypothetical protein